MFKYPDTKPVSKPVTNIQQISSVILNYNAWNSDMTLKDFMHIDLKDSVHTFPVKFSYAAISFQCLLRYVTLRKRN